MVKPWEEDWGLESPERSSSPDAAPWEQDWGVGDSEPESDASKLQFANKGLATAVGAPVDAANWLLRQAGLGVDSSEQIGGSEWINRKLAEWNISTLDEPDDIGENLALGIGEAIGGAGVVSGAGRLAATKGTGVVKQAGEFLQKSLGTSGPSMAGATAIEAAGGGGSRVAEHIAEESGVENPALRSAIGIAGGMLSAAGPGLAGAGTSMLLDKTPVVNIAKQQLRPLTGAGRREIAADMLQSRAADPEAAARAATRKSDIALTPSQKTGDEGLMEYERQVAQSDPEFRSKLEQRALEQDQAARHELKRPGGSADPAQFRQTADDYVTAAQQEAERRIAILDVRDTPEARSTIVREELERAEGIARQQEDALWEAVPMDMLTFHRAFNMAYSKLKKGLPSAQRKDWPKYVDDVVKGWAETDAKKTSVHEMHGLRSRLVEDAKKAYGRGDENAARIRYGLAEAIRRDLSKRGRNKAYNSAREFSDQLAKTFQGGAVGRILRPKISFDQATGQVLGGNIAERSLDAMGGLSATRTPTRAKLAIEDMQEAARHAGVKGTMAINDAVRDQIRDEFSKVSQNRRAAWYERNQSVLEKFPGLNREIRNAVEFDTSDVTGKGSALGEYAQAGFGREFDAVMGRSVKDPKAAGQELMQKAREADRALGRNVSQNQRSLKAAAMDYVLRNASRNTDEAGRDIISGDMIQRMLNDRRTRAALEGVLSSGEMRKLKNLARELFLKGVSENARVTNQPVVDSSRLGLPVIGARIFSAWVARRSLQTGTLQAPQFASSWAGAIADKLTARGIENLIKEAMLNDQLYRDLMMRPAKGNQEALRMARRRVTEAIIGIMSEQALGDEEATDGI